MYWRIQKDHLVDGSIITKSRVGYGVGNEVPHNEPLYRVRLFDDDGELYYEGVSDDDGLEHMFNWASRDAGVTLLQILMNGVWRDEIG